MQNSVGMIAKPIDIVFLTIVFAFVWRSPLKPSNPNKELRITSTTY